MDSKQETYISYVDKAFKSLQLTHFNFNTLKEEPVHFKLSVLNALVLICKPQSQINYVFDLTRLELAKNDYDKEMKYRLPKRKYIVFKEKLYHRRLFLTFETEAFRNKMFTQLQEVFRELRTHSKKETKVLHFKEFIEAAEGEETVTLHHTQIARLKEKICPKSGDFDKILACLNHHNSSEIGLGTFLRLCEILECRKELIPVFERYSGKKVEGIQDYSVAMLGEEGIMRFLKEVQQERKSQTARLSDEILRGKKAISFVEFCAEINRKSNQAQDPSYLFQPISLDFPLNLYYCYSSHNTYLVGNQLTSESKAERYLEDLQNGIRCLEIDAHDGPDGPVVTHGYTLTSCVSFEQVIEGIAYFCRENPNHTPIILSIENHCCSDNQFEMATVFDQYLGDRIFKIGTQVEGHKFPTLRETMGKVIIKNPGTLTAYKEGVARLKQKYFEINDSSSQDHEIQKLGLGVESPEMKLFREKIKTLEKDKSKFEETRRKFILPYLQSVREDDDVKSKKGIHNIKLLMMTAMLGGGNFDAPSPWESISLNEKKIEKKYKKQKKEAQAFTERGWIRAYPDGSRFDSSNYNPYNALDLGVQIIALNTQSEDYLTQTFRKFFMKSENIIQGYRLKDLHPASKEKREIQITPVSCFRVESNTEGVLVKMMILGPEEELKHYSKYHTMKPFTEKITDNFFNPIFEKPKPLRITYNNPDMLFILLEVPGCGTAALPVSHIRKGYRVVNLYGEGYELTGSKILCLIE